MIYVIILITVNLALEIKGVLSLLAEISDWMKK